MIPGNGLLETLLRSMWSASDPDLTAYAQNYLFEERVSTRRQQDYEAALGDMPEDIDSWDRWHRGEYLWRVIHREVPETFTAVNGDAAHSGDLAPEQYLVRVEGLEHALGETGFAIDELNTVLEVSRTGSSRRRYGPAEAVDALMQVCESLNRNPFGVRPRFAGFFQDVEDTLAAPDWPNQARDRFGLGHYTAMPGETIPIALMRYRVREVLAAANGKDEARHPVCVPTVLDAQFSRFFIPAPRELPYGRTLNLADDENCERKIAEVLHLRVEYRPEHLYKVGAVTQGLEKAEAIGLARLRNNHLFCLQYDSGRNDFGTVGATWNAR